MPETTPKNILVVDDEMDMRIFISAVLKTGGYRPTATREGGDGIKRAREMRPDAIILDVMMPGDGGVTMYRALKTDPQLCRIPVIMASAVSPDAFSHYLKMLNARLPEPVPDPVAYLEKPIDPDALLAQLNRIFQQP